MGSISARSPSGRSPRFSQCVVISGKTWTTGRLNPRTGRLSTSPIRYTISIDTTRTPYRFELRPAMANRAGRGGEVPAAVLRRIQKGTLTIGKDTVRMKTQIQAYQTVDDGSGLTRQPITIDRTMILRRASSSKAVEVEENFRGGWGGARGLGGRRGGRPAR